MNAFHAEAGTMYRRGTKQKGWTNFNGAKPYQEHFGDNWETELARIDKF
jgi:hypothetical protein